MDETKETENVAHEEVHLEAKSTIQQSSVDNEVEPAPHLHSKTFLVVAVCRPR